MADPTSDSTVSNLNPNPDEQSTPAQDATSAMSPDASKAAPAAVPTAMLAPSPSANDNLALQNAATPQAGAVNPALAQQAQQDPHQSRVAKILGVIGGGSRIPVKDANGNPVVNPDGTVRTVQGNAKQLGAGILAEAIAGLFAGAQHVPDRNGNGVVSSHIGEAAAAGAQAAQAQSPTARIQQSQQRADAQKLQQYRTMKQNLDLQSIALTNDRLGEDAINRHVEQDKPLHDFINQERENSPELDQMVHGDELGEDEMHQKMKDDAVHGTKDTAIAAGSRPEIGSDGKPTGRREQTWMVISNDAKIKLTPELAQKYGLENITGQTVPLANLMKYGMQATTLGNVKQTFASMADSAGAKGVTLDDWRKQNRTVATPQNIHAMQQMAGHDLPTQLQIAGQIDSSGALRASLLNTLGLNNEAGTAKLQKMADDKAAATKKAADQAAAEVRKQEAAEKAQTPIGQAQLAEKKLQVDNLQRQADEAGRQAMGLVVPDGFKADPLAVQMGPEDLKSNLANQGVDVPGNYHALYAIGHNAADLKTLPNRPQKGTNQMSQQEGLTWIRQYINPQYQEGDFSAAAGLSKELASLKTNTAGGSLANAGVASQHLEQLAQAADALKNDDTQVLNRIANAFGVAVGKSPAVTFRAIAEQANTEVAKVVAGGQPREAELAANRSNLNTDQSPEQTNNVIKAYIGLMSGRIREINDRSQQYFGRNVKGISDDTRRVFKKYGFDTPEAPDQRQQQIDTKPVQLTDFHVSPDGKTQIGRNPQGQWINVATGKPYAAPAVPVAQ